MQEGQRGEVNGGGERVGGVDRWEGRRGMAVGSRRAWDSGGRQKQRIMCTCRWTVKKQQTA